MRSLICILKELTVGAVIILLEKVHMFTMHFNYFAAERGVKCCDERVCTFLS